MIEVVENQALVVEHVQTTTQKAIVKTYYDQEFHTKLSVDKLTILADGIDKATITAEVYNYLDEVQTVWTGDIVFVLDGIEQIVSTTNGTASITFSTSVAGEYMIRTNIPNFRQGEIKVVAK
jgi:hypothetical protein